MAPELAAKLGARGWVTGEVRWRGPLLLAPGEKPSLEAHLSEAVVVLDNVDASGRPSPIRLRNKSPLAMKYDGNRLTLLEEAVVTGPTGDFVVSGSGSPEALDFKLRGRISVALLEPYFRQTLEGLDGALAVRLALGSGRARLIRLWIADSLVLAAAAAGLGLLVAWWLISAVAAFKPPVLDVGQPEAPAMPFVFQLDVRVFAFTFVVAAGAALLVGLIAGIQGSRGVTMSRMQASRESVRRFAPGFRIRSFASFPPGSDSGCQSQSRPTGSPTSRA